MDSNELQVQFENHIKYSEFGNQGTTKIDGVVTKLAVGKTDIELETNVLGVDKGFITVSTKKYGVFRFKSGYGLGVTLWLKPSQKAALLELLK